MIAKRRLISHNQAPFLFDLFRSDGTFQSFSGYFLKRVFMTTRAHLTDTVLMVRPTDFRFNYETALDNEFQKPSDESPEAIIQSALREFSQAVKTLQTHGVTVMTLDKKDQNITPDAVFPNNWFTTNPNGQMFLFPMKALNRNLERRYNEFAELAEKYNRKITGISFVGIPEEQKFFLEGTGVLIFDHLSNSTYAALSERCHPEQIDNYRVLSGLGEAHTFETRSKNGKPIYHTNVMLSIGEKFAVICSEVIVEKDRQRILDELSKTKEVIDITEQQMEQFAGNILQVKNRNNERLIAMSQSAYNAFTAEQREQLAQHGQLLPMAIPTIEGIGGGSIRCMLAEVFLPHKNA